MSDRRGTRRFRGGVRVFRLPRAAGVALTIPAFLAVGTATLTLLLLGVSVILLAPVLRGRGGQRRDRRTITLDPSAYRRVDDASALVDTSTGVADCERS
jgi:hypothetical protein